MILRIVFGYLLVLLAIFMVLSWVAVPVTLIAWIWIQTMYWFKIFATAVILAIVFTGTAVLVDKTVL